MLKILKDRDLYQRFQKAQTYMMYHQNGLGTFFTGLIRRSELRIVDAIPGNVDAAVAMKNTHPVLLIAKCFFDQPLKEQVLTLCHELRHLVYEHPLHYKNLNGPKLKVTYSHGRTQTFSVANLAMDGAINEMEIKGEIPDGWIMPSTFGAPSGRNTLFYYEFIMRRFPKGEGRGKDDEEDNDRDIGDCQDLAEPGQQDGQDGDTDQDTKEDFEQSDLDKELQRIMEQVAEAFGKDGNGSPIDPHQIWEIGPDGDGNENLNVDLARKALHQIVREAAESLTVKQRGELPDYLRSAIEASMRESVIPWNIVLRRITASMGTVTISTTISRKHKNLGIRPGTRIKPTKRIVVFLDESASVSSLEWEQFRSEIHYLWKQGVEIWVVTHDAAIHKVYRYNGKNLHKDRSYGGTDHTPCVEWINKSRLKFDGAIFLTDGGTCVREGLRPRTGCKAVWCISPGGVNVIEHVESTGINWGSIVMMQKFGQKAA